MALVWETFKVIHQVKLYIDIIYVDFIRMYKSQLIFFYDRIYILDNKSVIIADKNNTKLPTKEI